MEHLPFFRRMNVASQQTLLRRMHALHRLLSDRPSSLRHHLSTGPHAGSGFPSGFSTGIAGGQALGRMHAVGMVLLVLLVPAGMLTAGTGIWKQLAVPPSPGSKYTFIDFADSCNGWVMATDGCYSMTQDGGRTWSQPEVLAGAGSVVGMKRYGRDSALVVNRWSSFNLLRTTDRGSTWSKTPSPDPTNLSQTFSLVNDSLIGLVSQRGRLYTSTDLGGTWQSDSLPPPFGHARYFGILSMNRMLIGTSDGLTGFLSMSIDGGKTWTSLLPFLQLVSLECLFLSPELCWFDYAYGDEYIQRGALAYNAVLDKSQRVPTSSMGALFRDGSVFSFLAGSRMSKRVADPTDSTYHIGASQGTGTRISTLSLCSPHHGWVLDDSGKVYQSMDLLVSAREEEFVPAQMQLLQNYPNPFNAHTTIRYTLPSSGVVDLRIVDVLGREVFRSVEIQTAGAKSVPLDLSAYASGIYYCSLRFNGLVQTVKMALVR
jgi:hypothetical protein